MGKFDVAILVIVAVILLGCSSDPSDEEIDASVEAPIAIAQTEIVDAIPTKTLEATDTATPVPSNTPVPPTETALPTPIQPTETATPPPRSFPENAAEFEVTFDNNGCTVNGPAELQAGEHTFIFIDRSQWRGELWLLYLQEGKTFQDHLDLQYLPGVWYPKPPWVFYDARVSVAYPELNGESVELSTWKLDRVGEHFIICYVESPKKLWNVAPIMVVEAPSE